MENLLCEQRKLEKVTLNKGSSGWRKVYRHHFSEGS